VQILVCGPYIIGEVKFYTDFSVWLTFTPRLFVAEIQKESCSSTYLKYYMF